VDEFQRSTKAIEQLAFWSKAVGPTVSSRFCSNAAGKSSVQLEQLCPAAELKATFDIVTRVILNQSAVHVGSAALTQTKTASSHLLEQYAIWWSEATVIVDA